MRVGEQWAANVAALGLALVSACAADERRDSGTVPSIGSGVDTQTSSASADGDADGSSEGEGDGEGEGETNDAPRLDVHAGNTTGMDPDGGETGCEKVDLLFVIDDSISMDDEQANLIASFPAFITGMQEQLADTDGYHVGVITSDAYAGDPTCGPSQRGTLVTQTGGAQSSNAVCGPYASGKRFMTEEDDLATAFACAAQVGTEGDPDERPIEAMLAALSPGQLAVGGCNEGFLRDDALLVVVIITDEEDDHEMGGCNALPGSGSVGEPNGWYDQLVAIKGGDETAIVMLALVGPKDPPLCPEIDKCNIGSGGSEVANRIIQLTESFTHGFVGGVCHAYGPFFDEAIGTIESACDDFQPPG